MAENKSETAGLTVRQEMAVRALARGKGVAQAARAVGVNRGTLFRWLREPEFIAALNRWREGVMTLARGQRCAAAPDAAEALVKAARGGDVRAAGMLLKGLGILVPQEACSVDPRVIAKRQRVADLADRVGLDEAEQALKVSEALSTEVPSRGDGTLGVDWEDIESGDIDYDPADVQRDISNPRPPTEAEIKAAVESMMAEKERAAQAKATEERLEREKMGFHERRAAGDPKFQDDPKEGWKS